jgi:ATP-dependent Zn protease
MQKNAVMSEKKKRLVAYHEAGHALVGALMPEYDPVTKISIVPRGNAGGLTFFAPDESRLESGLYSRTVRSPLPLVSAQHVIHLQAWITSSKCGLFF